MLLKYFICIYILTYKNTFIYLTVSYCLIMQSQVISLSTKLTPNKVILFRRLRKYFELHITQ